MPPPITTHEDEVSDAASSEGDMIAPKRPEPKKKSAARSKAPVEEIPEANGDDASDDDDDDEGGDEYIVEKILEHAFDNHGSCKYRVKWLGYEQDEDQTWEPEESFDGAKDTLHKYWDHIGGKPEPKPKTPAAKGGRGKGKRKSVAAEATPETTTKRGKRAKTKQEPEDASKYNYPIGSWEDEIASIESIEERPTDDTNEKGLLVYLLWNDGHKSNHAATLLHTKCPQKLLSYYESKLVFKSGADAANSVSAGVDDDVDA